MDEIEIEVARPGTFNAYRGGRLEFTESSLREIADGFDAGEVHKLKLGHLQHQAAPAYGSVRALRWDSLKRRLLATIRPVAELAKWIREGRYPDRSMELGGSRGRWTFKHLAFLGHAEPAIGGLTPIHMTAPTGDVQMVFLSSEDDKPPGFAYIDLSEDARRRGNPRSLAVHDVVVLAMKKAWEDGESLTYTQAFFKASADPANEEVFRRW